MAVKVPVRTVFDGSGNATGLAEFQTGEAVGYQHGGTGIVSLGTAGQVLQVNANTDGLEWTAQGGINSISYTVANSVLTITSADGTTETPIATDKMSVANTQALANARLGATATVQLTGDVTGSASFSGNSVSISTTYNNDVVLGTDTSGNYVETLAAGNNSVVITGADSEGATKTVSLGDNIGANTSGNAATATKLATARTIQVSGDQAGSASFDGTGDINIAVTTQADSVDLGTHTTGNYVATIAGTTNEIEVSGSGSETAAVTIGLPNDVTLTGDLTVSGGDITLGGTGRIQGVDTVSAGTDAANKTYVDNAVAGIVDSAPAALDTLNELAAALGDDANFATTVSTNIGQKLGATASVTLTGDVTGSASFSANAVSIATTYNNDVVLGTDTSGNYVATITGGTGITSSGATTGEGIAHSLSVDYGTSAGTACQGNDARLSDSRTCDNTFDNAATARTNLGLGSLATLSTVNASTITDNSVGAAELNVTGNGTADQYLASDGDGTMTWKDIPASYGDSDVEAYLSGGAGISFSSGVIAVDSDQRGDITQIGQDTNDYFTVGTTTQSWFLDGAEDMRLTNNGQLDVEGSVVAHSSTVSDERLKENITPVENALEIVKQLNGVSFNYKKDGKPAVGLIAQDVEKVVPSAVQETEILGHEGEQYKILEYTQLIGVLVEAIKDQQEQIEELKSKL